MRRRAENGWCRFAAASVGLVAAVSVPRTQDVAVPNPAVNPVEATFLADAADRLHRHAGRWFKVGFSVRARRIWREVVAEYAADHAPAWEAMGYLRLGTVWAPDEQRPYPTRDRAAASRARSLTRKWATLAQTLASGHRKLAGKLAVAGDEDRAAYHYRRALRFAPDDSEAARALGYRLFDGIWGRPDERDLLSRSRWLRQTVSFLRSVKFPVRPVAGGERHPLLDAAKVNYIGVRSENFVVWGDQPTKVLSEAARNAERALHLCRTAFAGYRNYLEDPVSSGELAFFNKRETWLEVLDANRDLLEARQLQFLRDNCSAANLDAGGRTLYVAWDDEPRRVMDHAVRRVALDLAALRTDALKEGVGHAVVQLLLGRNLIFLMNLQEERGQGGGGPTVAASGSRERSGNAGADPLLNSDLAAWTRMAIDEAWQPEGTPFAKLPLIAADQFSRADRVKAWAVCDYLLRRDPDLLRAMSDAGEGASSVGDVVEGFGRYADPLLLADLEAQWRQFWTEEERLLRRVMRPPVRKPAAADRNLVGWVNAFNQQRLALGLHPVGWIRSEGPALREYATALRKGLTAIPASVSALAGHVLVATGGKPEAVVTQWLSWPGYRHALLDPYLSMLPCAERRPVVLLDVSGDPPRALVGVGVYPVDGQSAVPRQVAVSAVGAPLARLLDARGHAEVQHIGYPLTLHFYGDMAVALEDVECLLRCDDEFVESVVHVSPVAGETDRRLDARGLVTCYPLTPLRANATVVAAWAWTAGSNRRERVVTFSTN